MYLVAWTYMLFGRSGAGFDGAVPLSHREILSWSHLTGNVLEPWEVEALVELDAAIRHPDPKESDPEVKAKPVKTGGWPQRRTEPVLVSGE